jgi:two-component system nitrogen regulation response regulator GlnG
MRLRLPPLRERTEDIPLLAQSFLTMSARQLNTRAKTLLPETLEALTQLPFPGNVRQLQNICHWVSVMISAPEITVGDLPKDLAFSGGQQIPRSASLVQPTSGLASQTGSMVVPTHEVTQHLSGSWIAQLGLATKKLLDDGRTNIYQELLDQFEKCVIEAALEKTRGRKVEAAERLGIGRNTITRKVQDLGID